MGALPLSLPHSADEETEAREGLEAELMSLNRKSGAGTSSQGPSVTVTERQRNTENIHRGTERTERQRHRKGESGRGSGQRTGCSGDWGAGGSRQRILSCSLLWR